MRIATPVTAARQALGWGAVGALVGLGSVGVMLVLIVVTGVLRVATEHVPVVGTLLSILASLQIFAVWFVPVLIFNLVTRRLGRKYVPTDREARLAAFAACVTYGLHLPLVLLVLVLTSAKRWTLW